MTFGKDFNAEQRAAFDAMSAERGSGMDASLLNQDRSSGNVEGTDYYNAIRDEAIKPNNILNGYLGIQEIPNLMANGSSTRGSRGNRSSGMTMPTLQERGIGTATQGSGMGVPTLQEQGIGDAQQYLRQNMMANGSNSGRGVNTSLSNTIGRDVASGMGDGLNDVMRMTENIQSKYGDPNDRTVDQIMSQYNVDNAENAFQGMDNNRGLLQRTGDALVPDFYQPSSGVMMNLNRLLGGSDVTDQQIANHLDKQIFTPTSGNPHDRSNVAYNNQNIINNALSDARNGYHIASGKDYGSMTKGDLPGGGLPATLGALAYQQVDGIADSSLFDVGTPIMDTFNNKTNNTRASWNDIPGQLKEAGQFISSIPSGFETAMKNPFGTFGANAFLQSADNIEGLRQSGNAPFLDKAYEIGQRIKLPSRQDFIPQGLLDRFQREKKEFDGLEDGSPSIFEGTKFATPVADKPVVVTPKQTVADRKGYTPKPVAVVKPKVKVNYNKNKPVAVKKTKPTPRGPAPVKVTRTTGSRGGRGNVAAKRSVAKKSTPSKSYSSYSRRVGGR